MYPNNEHKSLLSNETILSTHCASILVHGPRTSVPPNVPAIWSIFLTLSPMICEISIDDKCSQYFRHAIHVSRQAYVKSSRTCLTRASSPPGNLSNTASESHSRNSAKSSRSIHSPSSPQSPKTPMHGMLHSPIQKLTPEEWGGNGSSEIVESSFVSQGNKNAPQWRQMSIVRRYRSWFGSDFMCLKLRIRTR